jgi:aconitate hydratase
MFRERYSDVFNGGEQWRNLETPTGSLFKWDSWSTYIKNPPYFEGMGMTPAPVHDIADARVLALLGDSVTTDHISPAGSISPNSPAGIYLRETGVDREDFNQYGARRGHDDVMVRGTFANVRLKNLLVPGVEGNVTLQMPANEEMSIFDAAMRYKQEKVPAILICGKEYGTGSSRDWAAKGPYLQGVRAVIAESLERIHRSNLIGMGILPLTFLPGEGREALGLTGHETYSIDGIANDLKPGKRLTVRARREDGSEFSFDVTCRIDTPVELDYYHHGGILQFVLRQLVSAKD